MEATPIAAGKSSFGLIDQQAFLASLPINQDTVLLDAGCGVGHYTIFLAPHVPKGRIYAIDLWKEGISRLEERIKEAQITNVIPICCDLSKELPLEDNSIDLCLMATVLHDLVQDRTHLGTISEIKRVLKPQGILSVVEFKKIDGPPGPPRAIRLSRDEVEDIVKQFRFSPIGDSVIGEFHYMVNFILNPATN